MDSPGEGAVRKPVPDVGTLWVANPDPSGWSADRGAADNVRGPARLGTASRGVGVTAIDLGADPPLVLGDERDDQPIRRAVSVRWLAGTILTGVTSVFLMGGALLAALDNANQFAETSSASARDSAVPPGTGMVFGQKGDRIQPIQQEISSRQILQVSTVSKQGERDFIKLRPFAKIVATLATRKSEIASEIPPYDALRIFADTSEPEAPAAAPGAVATTDDQIYGADVDGEVAIKVSAFSPTDAESMTGGTFSTSDVEEMVREIAGFGRSDAAMAYADADGFDDDPGPDESPFSALGVRIVPENVSSVAKSSEAGDGEGIEERVIAVAKGQSFRGLLDDNDIDDDDAAAVIAGLADLIDLNRMHVGQKIRLAYAPDPADPERQVAIRVSIYDDGAHQATVARADDRSYVRADAPDAGIEAFADVKETVGEEPGSAPRVYDALYQTALEQQIPKPLIDQLIRVFAFDVDFQARVSPGDAIEVFHSLPETNAQAEAEASEPEVLFAALTIGGVSKRFYRYRTGDDGIVDYYDDEGKSAKKFLMRKPVTAGVLRSTFGSRRHPILGYRRMHAGVDYAAPRGTPILAAGNGIVEKAGRASGYGNFTLIKHTNGYETAYGHQTAFAKGIVPGARVRQGQVIGYVGSTGLSTGPHLHFEIRVNNSPVDPLRIRLPRGRVLEGPYLAAFMAERARIDALLGTPAPPTKVAAAGAAPTN